MVSLASRSSNGASVTKKSYAKIPQILDIPNLIQIQIESFDWLKAQGLRELFQEISPIEDFTGERFELKFLDHEFFTPSHNEVECKEKERTYSAPLSVTVRLLVKQTGEVKEQQLFMGDIPLMTTTGTFIINGAERVVVSQLVRSPGAYFTTESDPISGRELCSAKLIPYRGAWMEFETSTKDVLSVKVDRKRKIPVTTLLRALGYSSDEDLVALFHDVDSHPDHHYIKSTMEKDDQVRGTDEALLEFYRRLRPGEPPSVDNAKNLVNSLFLNPRRYDLGRVGRYKLTKRLGTEADQEVRTLTPEDILTLIKTMIRINNGELTADDIDHLGNRRIRAVGELIQNQLRVGLLRMERVVKERMATQIDPASTTPAALINIRPVVAAVREFFGGSQLSQFMDQTNPLAELTHKRRLSALGPGGLSRERAGFDVRDVHHSHYGRICPIETPEGPNIGLLGSLSTYARTNQYGFIETPYRKVLKELPNSSPDLKGRTVTQDLLDADGQVIVKARKRITKEMANSIASLASCSVHVKPFVSSDPKDITYLSADEEEEFIIAQANTPLDGTSQIASETVETRMGQTFSIEPPGRVNYMDVSPMQIVSVSTSLIPFLERDDANRALMGSNMQRQAVPLLRPEAPLVSTGMEERVAQDSGQVILSNADGVVTSVTGDHIAVTDAQGQEHSFRLSKFLRSNQGTCISQRPVVSKGEKVRVGQPLVDSSSSDGAELALGQNVLVAFMTWEGYNFEDAIIISENVIKNDKFTSIHIEKHEAEARDTKLGPEEITRDIPNVGEESLRDLDEEGVIRKGAEVGPGDILVGKITPKGETELTAEEKLLRAIFGEKARDVKDTSLRVPHGEKGKVIDVRVLTRDNKDELPPGVNKLVRVWVAQTRKLTAGDKMAGRHGNKGVVARILPAEEMPFLPDGTPIDIILNPIGVPSRMNLGQVLEAHLGWAAHALNFKAVSPVFDGAPDMMIEDSLAQAWVLEESQAIDPRPLDGMANIDWDRAKEWLAQRGYDLATTFDEKVPGRARQAILEIWLREKAGLDTSNLSLEDMEKEAHRQNRLGEKAVPIFGKAILRDGRTGEPFDQPVTIGYIYMMKLIHLVEDKIHARSTGPYSLITQQPLGGKAQFGGQRFGEMEVWALEAYSAAYNLQEVLTVKSDDVVGRLKTYEAIVKGENIIHPGVPESFHVLVKELQSLGLSVELLMEEEKKVSLPEAPEDESHDEPFLEGTMPDGNEGDFDKGVLVADQVPSESLAEVVPDSPTDQVTQEAVNEKEEAVEEVSMERQTLIEMSEDADQSDSEVNVAEVAPTDQVTQEAVNEKKEADEEASIEGQTLIEMSEDADQSDSEVNVAEAAPTDTDEKLKDTPSQGAIEEE